MPTPRGAAGVAALGSRICVAGGLAAAGSVNTFEAFEPASNTWVSLPPLPTARDHLTAQAAGGKFYALSGRTNVLLNVNEEYDPATNAWRARAPIPTPRGGLGSGTIGGRIQVFGGEGSSTPTGTFQENEEYDPAANTWRTLAPMPTPRHGLYGATVGGNRIYAPSGGARAGANFSNVHEAFYLPPAARPAIHAAGVVNAASFRPEVAAGALASVFGVGLAPGAQVAVRQPLPTQMNATSVLINGKPAPLLFVGPNQMNFQVPSGTAAPATIVVEQAGVAGDPQTLPLFGAAPGLFSVSQDGRGQGAILHAGTAELASPSRPAVAGEVLEVYFTGLGESLLAVVPDVTVGGVPAELLFVGNAPGFVGLNQVNIRVPAGVTPSDAAPVRLTHLGRSSNEVTIAVK